MRLCARMSCPAEPVATIALRYADRRILIGELARTGSTPARSVLPAPDGDDPPVGWLVDDARLAGLTADRH